MSMDFLNRYALDNLREGVQDKTLICWPAFDVKEQKEVFVVGRKVSSDKVLPLAILVGDSVAALKRYAPATAPGVYDFSQTE